MSLASATLAQTVPNYVPTNGLVAWYPFNGNANDESGNGHNGIANNGATLTTDRFSSINQSYYLDGVNDYISSTLGSLNRATFSFWYNSVYPINFYPMFIYIDNIQFCVMGGNNPAWIQNNNVGFLGGYSNVNSTNYISSLPSIPTFNNWHHVVIVYDNSINKHSIYIDGAICGTQWTAVNPLAINSGNVCFGNTPNGTIADGNAGLKGKLDDIGIWNRALTQQEISDLYNANICYDHVTVTDTLIINTSMIGFNPVTYQNTIKVWPNPAHDHITIDNGNIANLNGYQIKISNVLGQQVFQSAINQQQFYINLSTWTGNGTYYINLINPQGVTVETRVIVVQ